MDLVHGKMGKKMLLFALPLAVTGILQQLFNAADVMVIGRFVGKEAMAAVGSNSPIIGILVNLFIGLSLGTNVVIAQYTGSGDKEKVSKAVHTSVLVALISGIFVTVFGELIANPLLHLMDVPENVFPMAILYLRIYLLGMPVILLYNFESSIYRSRGDTKTPLICLVVSGVINVCLNLFFVLVCHMTVDGVALATVIANAVSSGLMFFFLLRSKSDIKVRFHCLRISKDVLKRIMQIGIPSGIQGMVFSLSNILIQSAINSLGSDVMAGSSAAFNVEIMAYYVVNSFGQAAATFVSQNYGYGDMDRCKRASVLALLQDEVAGNIVVFTIIAFAPRIIALFNADQVVIMYGAIRLRYLLSAYCVDVLIEVFSGVMRAYGYSLFPALATLFGVCGVRIVWVWTVFRAAPSFQRLMVIYPISWIVTAILLVVVYYWKVRSKVFKANREEFSR